MHKLSTILKDTGRVLTTKWESKNLDMRSWGIKAFIWIAILRSLTYGVDLLLLKLAATTQVMAFVALLGIPVWGWLIIISSLLVVIGLITKNLVLMTVGTLMCTAVWMGFSLILLIALINLGIGGRFVIVTLCTTSVWLVFFLMHLKTIRKNGVK